MILKTGGTLKVGLLYINVKDDAMQLGTQCKSDRITFIHEMSFPAQP